MFIYLVNNWAATENIQLRSPRIAHLEAPEVVNYPSPFVVHSPHGFEYFDI